MPTADQPVVHPQRPLVFSIHGIRTRGEWQKSLTRELNRADLDYDPFDYGWFSSFRFLIPYFRNRHIEWFLGKYTESCRDGQPPPSIIAHSFGTYLVAAAMEKYPEIVFDHIILCGSIIPPSFQWSKLFNNQQVRYVLNDYSRKDLWSKVAHRVVSDAGYSGAFGFDEKDERLLQRGHQKWKHSDYFYKLNYTKNWIPFLKGQSLQPLTEFDRPPGKLGCWLVSIAAIVVLILGAVLIWWALRPGPPKKFDMTFQEFLQELQVAKNDGPRMAALQKHLHEQVTWPGFIMSTSARPKAPAYFVGLNKQSPGEEWFTARLEKLDDDLLLTPGAPVEVTGELLAVSVVGAVLEKCTVKRTDNPK